MPISYAPTSWNPVVGCTPVSEGCKNCWAMKLHNQRHKGYHSYKNFPVQYLKPFEEVQLLPDRLSEPLRWRKPRTVAVCFMGDLFHREVPDEFIVRVFEIMATASRHTFLLLTKRPERMRRILARNFDPPLQPWPLPNVWLGVTAENRRMADERVPVLLDTPGKHWVSLEPLLGPVDLCGLGLCCSDHLAARLDGVIVGGESGPGHRPMDLQWAADILAQCDAAKVPYYFKQIAASRPGQASGVVMLDSAKVLPWPGEHEEPPQQEGEA